MLDRFVSILWRYYLWTCDTTAGILQHIFLFLCTHVAFSQPPPPCGLPFLSSHFQPPIHTHTAKNCTVKRTDFSRGRGRSVWTKNLCNEAYSAQEDKRACSCTYTSPARGFQHIHTNVCTFPSRSERADARTHTYMLRNTYTDTHACEHTHTQLYLICCICDVRLNVYNIKYLSSQPHVGTWDVSSCHGGKAESSAPSPPTSTTNTRGTGLMMHTWQCQGSRSLQRLS